MLYPPAILDIYLSRIVSNYKALQAIVQSSVVDPVVKADGYGLGAGVVAVALARAGARQFYVATLDEAIALRAFLAMASSDAQVAVLNGVVGHKDEIQAFTEHGLTPVLNSIAQVQAWASYGRGAPAILQFNTGMNRAGIEVAAVAEAKAKATFPVRLVMSHLACADTPEHPLHAEQKKQFQDIASVFDSVSLSLAASYGILNDAATHYDRVRAGAALYGGVPDGRVRPVVSVRARVLEVRSVDSGVSVGYGASYTTTSQARLATLAYGYADGYPRAASNKGYVMFGAEKAPIVGRVSMDLLTVDVSRIANVNVGDYAELLNDTITVNDVAAQADTIGYEILTRLGTRAERVYHD